MKSLCYNRGMKKGKRGFTLIEVAIFLAVTGALFVSVMVGVQNSVYQQRNNDSVQSFVEFLRGAYSETTNVQNNKGQGGGRTGKAIYGKLVTFGERCNLAGKQVINTDKNCDGSGEAGNQLFMYTVVGNVLDESGSGTPLELLDLLHAQVVEEKPNKDGTGKDLELMALAESYAPKWAAEIEDACTNEEKCYRPKEGMLLIVRHPSSGTVYTYYTNTLVQINEEIAERNRSGTGGTGWLTFNGVGFSMQNVDFCINSSGETWTYFRNNVRINAGAKSASGIEVIADEENGCIKRN